MSAKIRTLTTTRELAEFCDLAKGAEFVTVDTEFLREKTYYAQLCLVQLALSTGSGNDQAVLVDVLADGISLEPLLTLFGDESTIKVFHAARQDIEIFAISHGCIPVPVFDTQVAAMVCGFGDQVGYDALVRTVKKISIDKTSRFTDWSRRPLSAEQTAYALADVTHLRDVYRYLVDRLDATKRLEWVREDLMALQDPALYQSDPDEMWRKIKTRNHAPRFLNLVQKLAAFRERMAQERNIPRTRIFKDDALLELAATKPKNEEMLSRLRLVPHEFRRGDMAKKLLKAIAEAHATPDKSLPVKERRNPNAQVNPALAEMLRVVLNVCSAQSEVAPKLLASAQELGALASGQNDIPAMQGWRYDVFGQYAEKLCAGKLALSVDGDEIRFIDV